MKKYKKKKQGEVSYWQSYSDMMAALLLVFVLIIVFTISHAKVNYEEKEGELQKQTAQLGEQQSELKKQSEVLKEQESKLEQQNKEIEEFKKQIKSQSNRFDKVIGIRSEIVKELNQQFKNSDLDISIDPETGTICFDSSVLFSYNEYKLSKNGTKFLNKFFPKYFDVILKSSVKEYIAEVIIEGHTDNKGSYLYNLDLSQKRAFAVAEFCLGDNNNMFSEKKLEQVREIVTANGRSYYELKYNSNGKVDAKASRRVEVKFRLTEEEMINEISTLLNME